MQNKEIEKNNRAAIEKIVRNKITRMRKMMERKEKERNNKWKLRKIGNKK